MEHDYVEAIMVAANSALGCPYCDGLHTELADLAGVGSQKEIRAGTDVASCEKACLQGMHKPGVAFARALGDFDLRSPGLDGAYAKLETAEGPARAASIKALATFLYWVRQVASAITS